MPINDGWSKYYAEAEAKAREEAEAKLREIYVRTGLKWDELETGKDVTIKTLVNRGEFPHNQWTPRRICVLDPVASIVGAFALEGKTKDQTQYYRWEEMEVFPVASRTAFQCGDIVECIDEQAFRYGIRKDVYYVVLNAWTYNSMVTDCLTLYCGGKGYKLNASWFKLVRRPEK